MKRVSTLAIGVALGVLGAGSASAQWLDSPQATPDGIYARVEGGWSHVPGLTGTAPNTLFGPQSFSVNNGEGEIGGGAVGYKWGPFRGELNIDYSQQNLQTLNTSVPFFSGLPLTGHVSNLAFMANAYYDIATGTRFTPYVGFGVGAARLSMSNVSASTGFGSLALVNDTDTVFAYQPIAGVHYAISPRIELGLEYRYVGTTDANFAVAQPTNAFAGSSFKEQYQSHNVLLSLTWHFASPPPAPMPVAQPVAVPPAQPAPPPHQAQKFLVFFDFDRSTLTEAGAQVVKAAAVAYKNGGSAHLDVAGYTDLSGTQAYNLKLSERRADTVRDALVRDGVPASDIGVSWHGKENPRVPTPDGVREPQNRRVEINLP
jgi:outer membrane protein OmpA-like peptidoglycan-associated protein